MQVGQNLRSGQPAAEPEARKFARRLWTSLALEKSKKNDFPAALGNPAKGAGFPLSQSHTAGVRLHLLCLDSNAQSYIFKCLYAARHSSRSQKLKSFFDDVREWRSESAPQTVGRFADCRCHSLRDCTRLHLGGFGKRTIEVVVSRRASDSRFSNSAWRCWVASMGSVPGFTWVFSTK